MSLDELVEDGEAIGRLEPEGAPRRAKNSLEHLFRFPAQQHKLAPGDAPFDPATGKSAGAIVELDEAVGVLVLRRGPSHASVPLPTALIPPGPYDTRAQRAALARLGDAVLTGNGRYRALQDILARARPRLAGGFSGTIHTTDSREQRERAAALDNSYLFIQGPPAARSPLSGASVRSLPKFNEACCDRFVFIRKDPLDERLKTFGIPKVFGTRHLGRLLHRLLLPTKLTEHSHEV